MAIVNKFNVNKQEVTLDADIIENMSANDVSYNASTQYNENTVGEKLSELESQIYEGTIANRNDVLTLHAMTAGLEYNISENTHLYLPFLKRGNTIKITSKNFEGQIFYLRHGESVDGQILLPNMHQDIPIEYTLTDDFDTLFVYQSTISVTNLEFSLIYKNGLVDELSEQTKTLLPLLNEVPSIFDEIRILTNGGENIDVEIPVDESGKYVYVYWLKKGTKLKIKNNINEYSSIYFRYQKEVSTQLLLSFAPLEIKEITLTMDYDSFFFYKGSIQEARQFSLNVSIPLSIEQTLLTFINELETRVTSNEQTISKIDADMTMRGSSIISTKTIDGKYISYTGGLGDLASMSIYLFPVVGGKYYWVHTTLNMSSAMAYAVYSSSEPSKETLLILGPVVTAPREDYVLIRVPDNAAYIGITQYGNSEYSVYNSEDAKPNQMYNDIQTLKIKTDGIIGNTCIEMDNDGENLYIAYLENGIEYTFWFRKCMFNKLYTFYRVGYRSVTRINADTDGIKNDEGITLINQTYSDNIGPLSFYPGGWSGGNHSWNNDGVTKTAKCDMYNIKVDGRNISNGQKLFANRVEILVQNTIYDPAIAPESGATILSTPISVETVKYVVYKNNIEVSVRQSFVSNPTTSLSFYYGMQSMFENENAIMTPRGQFVNWQQIASGESIEFSKSDYPNFNRFIERSNESYYQSSYLIPNKLGSHDKTTRGIFSHSYNKSYHIMVNNTNPIQTAGQTIVWSGVYSFFVTPIIDNDYIFAYVGCINGKDAIFVNTKQAYEGSIELPPNMWMCKIVDVEKDDTITTTNEFVDAEGVQITATGTGSWIFVLE